jgi:tryptophan halogenase
MLGQGIMPRAYHPIAEKLPDEELTRFLGGIRDNVARTVAGLPDHGAYVARYCGATA